jgi:hypothetical protein
MAPCITSQEVPDAITSTIRSDVYRFKLNNKGFIKDVIARNDKPATEIN